MSLLLLFGDPPASGSGISGVVNKQLASLTGSSAGTVTGRTGALDRTLATLTGNSTGTVAGLSGSLNRTLAPLSGDGTGTVSGVVLPEIPLVITSTGSQNLFIERGHIAGRVDFTKGVFEFDEIRMRKNEPSLFSFSLVKVDAVDKWFTPSRGDYVRFEDTRWNPRHYPIGRGLLFSGYITSDPQYQYLGQFQGQQHWGYRVSCTSEDYLINSKKVPARTFINKTRGQILKSLLEDMFGGADSVPFNTSMMFDGGTERIYTSDPSRYWTEIAAEFGASDGFVYLVMDRHVMYVPEMTTHANGDTTNTLVIDEHDPRYNPTAIEIGRVESPVVNDLTVVGEDEPTTVCFEQFVSDGYQPSHELTYVPFGTESSELLADELSDELDDSTWEEVDPGNNITVFEGSLNVAGGPGVNTGTAYLRSRKGVELSGTIIFRDGEIFFPPSPTGVGIIGGLYTTTSTLEADLWAGWYIDLGANRITPKTQAGLHGQYVSINPNFHYILRRTVTVDRFSTIHAPIVDSETGYRYDEEATPVDAKISWDVDVIDTSDVNNVTTTRINLGTTIIESPHFVLFAAVVPYTFHLAMNFVSIKKPQQIYVEVDTTPAVDGSHIWTLGRTPILVGSSLDGGRCIVDVNNNVAKLNWFALAGRAIAGAEQEVTTIPPAGSVVSVRYYRSAPSRARIRNKRSILSESAKFKDDGIRQLTLTTEDVTPAPRSSEECLYIARAYLDDSARARYEGGYSFISNQSDDTNLTNLILPGDKVLCLIDTPDGQLRESLDVTNVTVRLVGVKAYEVELEFGPVNRYDAARRELIRRRHSSLQDILVPDIDVFEADVLKDEGFNPVPDPLPPTVDIVGPNYITVAFGSGPGLQDGIAGYECRTLDSGWGQGGEVARYTTYSRQFPRDRREVKYFFRSYRMDGAERVYSERSALVRHTYPLKNNLVVTGITGEWSSAGNVFKFYIPMLSDPDWGRFKVVADAEVIYNGDGVNNMTKQDRVTAFISNGRLQLEVKDGATGYPVVSSFTITVTPINLLGQESTQTTGHTVNK